MPALRSLAVVVAVVDAVLGAHMKGALSKLNAAYASTDLAKPKIGRYHPRRRSASSWAMYWTRGASAPSLAGWARQRDESVVTGVPRKPGTGNADATTLVFSGERRRERALAGPVLAARSAQRVGFRRAFARRSAAVSHRTLGHIGGALRTHHKSERDDVYRIHNGHKGMDDAQRKVAYKFQSRRVRCCIIINPSDIRPVI